MSIFLITTAVVWFMMYAIRFIFKENSIVADKNRKIDYSIFRVIAVANILILLWALSPWINWGDFSMQDNLRWIIGGLFSISFYGCFGGLIIHWESSGWVAWRWRRIISRRNRSLQVDPTSDVFGDYTYRSRLLYSDSELAVWWILSNIDNYVVFHSFQAGGIDDNWADWSGILILRRKNRTNCSHIN